jgi:hypothetical protein
MNKIMKALLEAKYPTLDANVLLDIAGQTPNATIAIEKLCGLYEPQTPESLGVYRIDRYNRVCTLINIDDWREEVIYKYTYEETQSCYVIKDRDRSIVLTVDNINDYKSETSEYADWVTIKTGKMSERTNSVSFGEWLGYTIDRVSLKEV